uniref:RRM domain-containing protein n=1 Tax=Manihot esculenta TaxID=3983 RepID=A0A2C9W898_MANES
MAMRARAALAAAPRSLLRLFSTNSTPSFIPPPTSSETSARQQADPNTNLFVSGLSKRTTSEGLSEAFSKFGEVVHARVVTDRVSGYSKGFGFVRYANLDAAAKGIEGMDGKFLDGWVIFAEYARPRPSPTPPGINAGPGYGSNTGPSYGSNRGPTYGNAAGSAFQSNTVPDYMNNAAGPAYHSNTSPDYGNATGPAPAYGNTTYGSNSTGPTFGSNVDPAYRSSTDPAYSNAPTYTYGNASGPSDGSSAGPTYSNTPTYENASGTSYGNMGPYGNDMGAPYGSR